MQEAAPSSLCHHGPRNRVNCAGQSQPAQGPRCMQGGDERKAVAAGRTAGRKQEVGPGPVSLVSNPSPDPRQGSRLLGFVPTNLGLWGCFGLTQGKEKCFPLPQQPQTWMPLWMQHRQTILPVPLQGRIMLIHSFTSGKIR